MMTETTNKMQLLIDKISKLTTEEIESEIKELETRIKKSKPLIFGAIRQIKKIYLLRAMTKVLSELFSHTDTINEYCIYMYYLAAEYLNRTQKVTYLLLVGKCLKIGKSFISLYEKERATISDLDVNQLLFVWLGAIIKWWQDTAHLMSDHQDIINLTIGKRKKEREVTFNFNDLTIIPDDDNNDVQGLPDTWDWFEPSLPH